ncbi:MAG TPA: MOSC domain-containing protein [Thermoanaerobaculia bacterium]|nr:MOSC domain-containing protein [Thermoanaerobaculia bacterium]
MNESGELLAIWLKRFKRGPMDAVQSAQLVAGRGLAGNTDQGGKRQVTMIDEAGWEAASRALGYLPGMTPDPRLRRANLMLRGISLFKTHGRVLRIGSVRIRIYGEVTPCRKMEESLRGLQEALRPEWRGGAFGEVLDDGEIRVGDAISWESVNQPASSAV